MNETDRLVAAIFAATMTARNAEPDLAGFFGFYDACLEGFKGREAVEAAAKVERTAEAHKKAWGE